MVMAKVGAVVIVREVVCTPMPTVPLWSSISIAVDAISIAVAVAIAVTIADAVVGLPRMVGWVRWDHVAETGDALGDVR